MRCFTRLCGVLGLVTALTAPAIAQQATPSEEAALQAYRQGSFSRTVSLYTQALSETEDADHRAQLHVRIAWTLFALGREDEVDTHLKAALVESPALTLLPDYYTQEFLDLFEAARQLPPSAQLSDDVPSPDLEATISSVELRIDSLEDLEGALSDVERLIASYPGDGRLIPQRIRLLQLLGRTGEANQLLQTHGGILPGQPTIARLSIPDLILRANELLDEGDVETSLDYLREAVSRQPSNVAALELMAEAAGRAARWQEAEFSLKSALALQPDNIGLQLRLGEVFLAMGDASAARDVFRQLTVRYPHSDRAWAALGLLDAPLGNDERALDGLARALHENPLLPEVQLAYGEPQHRRDDAGKDMERFGSAASHQQDDAQVTARLGQALLAASRWSEALQHLRDAVDGGFSPPGVQRALVLALVQEGYLSEAERRLAEIPTDNAGEESEVLQALILFSRERYAEAEAVLTALLDRRSNDVRVLNLLAATLYHQSRFAEALGFLERVHELEPTQPVLASNRDRAAAARAALELAGSARQIRRSSPRAN